VFRVGRKDHGGEKSNTGVDVEKNNAKNGGKSNAKSGKKSGNSKALIRKNTDDGAVSGGIRGMGKSRGEKGRTDRENTRTDMGVDLEEESGKEITARDIRGAYGANTIGAEFDWKTVNNNYLNSNTNSKQIDSRQIPTTYSRIDTSLQKPFCRVIELEPARNPLKSPTADEYEEFTPEKKLQHLKSLKSENRPDNRVLCFVKTDRKYSAWRLVERVSETEYDLENWILGVVDGGSVEGTSAGNSSRFVIGSGSGTEDSNTPRSKKKTSNADSNSKSNSNSNSSSADSKSSDSNSPKSKQNLKSNAKSGGNASTVSGEPVDIGLELGEHLAGEFDLKIVWREDELRDAEKRDAEKSEGKDGEDNAEGKESRDKESRDKTQIVQLLDKDDVQNLSLKRSKSEIVESSNSLRDLTKLTSGKDSKKTRSSRRTSKERSNAQDTDSDLVLESIFLVKGKFAPSLAGPPMCGPDTFICDAENCAGDDHLAG
jgi:hypothetical protein